MKRLLLLLLCTFLVSPSTFAQDEVYFYYWNKDGKICDKDTATSYAKIYREGDKWMRKEITTKNNNVYFEGVYLDKDCKMPHGKTTMYKEDGSTNYITSYDSGKAISRIYYHSNGAKKGFISYKDSVQQGWDENGNEIKNYITESFPVFGADWRNYLARSVNAKVAVDAGLDDGSYKVMVKFIIDKNGQVTDAIAIDVPPGCYVCGIEAVRVITNAPPVKPAILNNEIVKYSARQPIVFMVEGEKKKETKKRKRL